MTAATASLPAHRVFEVGPGLTCDLDLLLTGRMLVQASSGNGKTKTVRRILEQTHGHVQHLVIDPEGEYHTLRERYDYVLAAPRGGDTMAHPRTAALLAERLLQLGVSAILDIYELRPDERKRFVRLFVDALVNAPRDLWHPVPIILDEMQVFCPEKDEAESAGSIAALASQGRKRGFCLIGATQRLSKVKKDVAAELQNKLIGGCTLDLDVKRAADDLGFTSRGNQQLLRRLEPGRFYAVGRAFGIREPQLVHVGPTVTSHPEPGQNAAPVPPPTARVRAVLSQLADLPAEAEAREKTVEDLKRDNATLRRQLTDAQKAAPAPERVEVPVIDIGLRSDIERWIERLGESASLASALRSDLVDALARAATTHPIATNSAGKSRPDQPVTSRAPVRPAPTQPPSAGHGDARHGRSDSRSALATPGGDVSSHDGAPLKKCARAILRVLAQFPDGCTSSKLTLLTGYRYSGGFQNDLGALRKAGYLEGGNTERMRITKAGIALGPFNPLPTGPELADYWLHHPSFKKCARAILGALLENPDGLTKDEICAQTGYAYSGGFQNDLGVLRTAGVLVGKNTEIMRAHEDLLS